ncbi:response regulator [Diplocloster agilis]|uniref:Stage 0 sporulation protein A homolog n=1 Tax=Diplocloster agilis TaxID=2850323 RepID=A0A949K419_9FIRM|nr:response regulator [Diplocloster agilis]MBU9738430.1 response regulator [Diplocloster agilis]
MVKLFVVDDERMAVQYFQSLLAKTSLDYEVAGTALDGKSALDQLQSVKADILFVDINMPVMNGLEVAEAVLTQNPKQKIVFLTSYRDFDYIKKGMDIGINAYLLKNELTREKLEQEILRITEEIKREKEQDKVYREHSLRQYLRRARVGEGFTGFFKEGEFYGLLYVTAPYVIHVRKQEEQILKIDSGEVEKLTYPEGISCEYFFRIDLGWCGLIRMHGRKDGSRERLRDAAGIVLKYLEGRESAALVLYSEWLSTPDDLPDWYERELRVEEEKLCYGKGSLIAAEETGRREITNLNLMQYELELPALMERGDRMAERELLHRFLTEMREHCDDHTYEGYLRDLIRIYNRFAKQKQLLIDGIWLEQAITSMDEAEQWLIDFSIYIHRLSVRKEDRGYSRNIEAALKYIEAHYQEDIYIQMIADGIGISEGHLRRQFKEELSMTLNDYLLHYRITRAKEIMEHQKVKVSKIHEMVGFRSSQYFSSVFKKLEGVSPKEYQDHRKR